ncbi:M56 family metallopeptidase [Streptomyces sp. NPDC059142]|uniref:M56 family metallopeptidase n=1 Tax=Streptomyces sp. NPDC059142 TaxID=3346739 RepID=UPI00369382F8
MILCLLLLAGVAFAAAVFVPRVLTGSAWPEREPVVALWVWQCLVGAVLLSCLCALVLGAAAAFGTVGVRVLAPAPPEVVGAYDLASAPAWAAILTLLLACGAAWTAAMLVRQLADERRRRRLRRSYIRERAPDLPGESVTDDNRMVVLEDSYPDAWLIAGSSPRLVVTTGALHRLTDRQLDAVHAHELGHVHARHDWLLHLSTALATGFPRVPLFTDFADQTHRLVELAADDTASRRCGRRTTALALIELNQHRGVFSCDSPRRLLHARVLRLLEPPSRLTPLQRAATTIAAALALLTPLLITSAPGLNA